MLSCMLGILLLFMVVYLGLDMYARMNLAIKKSRIERKYILYMETYGYLTAEKQSGLTKELSDMGLVVTEARCIYYGYCNKCREKNN